MLRTDPHSCVRFGPVRGQAVAMNSINFQAANKFRAYTHAHTQKHSRRRRSSTHSLQAGIWQVEASILPFRLLTKPNISAAFAPHQSLKLQQQSSIKLPRAAEWRTSNTLWQHPHPHSQTHKQTTPAHRSLTPGLARTNSYCWQGGGGWRGQLLRCLHLVRLH